MSASMTCPYSMTCGCGEREIEGQQCDPRVVEKIL